MSNTTHKRKNQQFWVTHNTYHIQKQAKGTTHQDSRILNIHHQQNQISISHYTGRGTSMQDIQLLITLHNAKGKELTTQTQG